VLLTPTAFLSSSAAARDASPPDWRALPRLSFSELMSALRSGGRTASAEVWVDRDPDVYWPPPPLHQPFQGKRALLRFTDGTQAWAELPIPELEVRLLLASASTRGCASAHGFCI
jgi:hypothetical protein